MTTLTSCDTEASPGRLRGGGGCLESPPRGSPRLQAPPGPPGNRQACRARSSFTPPALALGVRGIAQGPPLWRARGERTQKGNLLAAKSIDSPQGCLRRRLQGTSPIMWLTTANKVPSPMLLESQWYLEHTDLALVYVHSGSQTLCDRVGTM